MQTNGSATPSADWREWAAFLGYVLVAALLISIALASIVLVLNVRTDDPAQPLIAAPSSSSSAIAAGTDPSNLLDSSGKREGLAAPILPVKLRP